MDKRKHKCSWCEKRFERPSDLKRHYRVHTKEKAFECDVCGKLFSQSGNLFVHKRIHSGDKPHECTTCNKSFSQKCSLVCHKRTHTGETPFICDKCGKAFSKKYHLICHSRTHLGLKPYTCPTCGKKFSQCGGLISHKRTHTGEKLFECNICGKKYSQASGLRKHKKTHIKEAFTCNICDKQFSQTSSLVKHKIIHSGGKYFDCNVPIRNVIPSRIFLDQKRPHAAVNLFKFDICVKVTKESYSDFQSEKGLPKKHGYYCDLCEEVFTSSELLTGHKEFHTGQQGRDIGTPEQLEHFSDGEIDTKKEPFSDRSHQTTQASTRDESYQCDSCEMIFASIELLILHQVLHTGQQMCDVVSNELSEHHLDDKIEAKKKSLHDRSHETASAVSQEELLYHQCDLCERIFASSELLTLHKEFHTGQKLNDVTSHEQLQNAFHLDSEVKADKPSGITYICADCDEEFELVDQLFKHSEMAHVISTF